MENNINILNCARESFRIVKLAHHLLDMALSQSAGVARRTHQDPNLRALAD
jgi:hypothetical protein